MLNKKQSSGFTLLELVVVMAVMGLMSTMAVDLYTNNTNQSRYDLTKQRLAEIKFAIIGDPMMRVGSQAVLRGFFNDMDRLPRSLDELITEGASSYCLHDNFVVDSTKDEAECGAALGYTWKIDASGQWEGPYLINIQSSGGTLVFQDAWGNSGGVNHGWEFSFEYTTDSLPIPTGSLVVQSIGLNRTSGTTGSTNKYENDYPLSTNKLVAKIELNHIRYLKGLEPNKGYCVVITTKKIDLNFPTETACDDNNPDPPAVPPEPTHIWATYPPSI
jgi:prepilin-type N-terminal cleavage/methylation domain-containing protein